MIFQTSKVVRIIGKYPDAGKDWGQEENGATGDKMIGWHQWSNGPEFDQTLADGEGQRSLSRLQFMGLQSIGHDLAT